MKFNKFLLFSTIVIFGLSLLPKISWAAVYYIAPDGSDTNDGSFKHPWKTIMYAVRNTGPGDTVMLRAGTYSEGDTWVRGPYGQGGKEGQFWTLQAYPGEKAIIINRIGIEANYVRIKGLHFVTPGAYIYVADGYGYGNYVEILNNYFTGDNNVIGAISSVGSYCLIEGNIINFTSKSGTATDHGIYIMAGKASTAIGGDFKNANTIVRNNIIINPAGWGIHVYDEYKQSGDLHRVIENIVIENNLIISPVLRGGIILGTGRDMEIKGAVVKNNIVIGASTDGIFLGLDVDNVKIYNNTIYKSVNNGVGIYWPATNIDIKNNIISSVMGNHISNGGNSPSLTVNNNLYWPDPPKLYNTSDPNPIVGDPKFVNINVNDFHLQPGSAAIDKGLTLAEVPKDKDGVIRPQGSNYDIGAYEYVSGETLPDTTPPNPPQNVRIQ